MLAGFGARRSLDSVRRGWIREEALRGNLQSMGLEYEEDFASFGEAALLRGSEVLR